ncbi:MAG: exodeoxyribonuclease VII small subunit [bacterium]|nr:exodeoxyribonuclease VII small subunit [bacterium]
MDNKQSFEDMLRRLEEIVQLLNNGGCPIDDALKLYEEGMKLSVLCDKKLKSARQSITKLSDLEGNNNVG